jgi:hypothetical protein
MSADRGLIRTTFASLLQQALVGTGKPAQAVYDHQVGDFGGQSPVVFVASAPIRRPPLTARGGRATVRLDVWVLVLYADPASGWTEADAEDRLDAIERAIAEVVRANQVNAIARWQAIDYAEATAPDFIEIGGPTYRRERIPLQFEVYASSRGVS